MIITKFRLFEGHISLTADEHKAVERVMKKLPEMFKNKLEPIVRPQKSKEDIEGMKYSERVSKQFEENFKFIKNLIDSKSTNIVCVDTIDYMTASGIKSKVGIYIVNEDAGYIGKYIPGDANNPEDNIILINQAKDMSIQGLRTTLIHELIHAKDPKANQKFTDRVKNTFKKDYYKRRPEFEAFTGQLLNVISNSTFKFLKHGWSSKELKEIFDDILEHFKDTKQDFIDAFSKQNPDFIKSITTSEPLFPGSNNYLNWLINLFEFQLKYGIDKYKDRTGLKPNTLMFLNREWDKNKSVDIKEFQNIIYDTFTGRLSEIKKINSDYTEFLKDLYKEIKKQVDFVNSKTKEKIELNYKTQSDWMKDCQNITYTSRTKIKKVPS